MVAHNAVQQTFVEWGRLKASVWVPEGEGYRLVQLTDRGEVVAKRVGGEMTVVEEDYAR